MSITKDTIKETIKTIMAEEGDYKAFFKKALEKAGKSIPSMSDEEKKKFFNKIDAAWDGKGEKNEGNAFGAAVVAAKEAGEDEFEVDGEKFKVEESVNEIQYDDAFAKFNKELENNSEIKKAAKHYKKSVKDVVKVLQSKIKVNRYSDKSIKQISINYTEDGPLSSKVTIKASQNYKQNESVNEAKNDNLYVVIDFHEKGGGFVMTKPSSKKLADDSARSITKTRDITKREVLKVKDARKIRGLAGKEYLKEESVNEVKESHSDCGCGCGGVTEGGCSTSVNEAKKFGDWLVTREDEKFGTKHIKLVNQNTMDDLYVYKSNGKFEVSYKKRRIVKPSLKQVMISVLKLGESVNEARLGKVLLLKDVEKGKTSSVEGVKLSKDLAFEIRTFLERPMLSRSRTGIKLDNSKMGDVIPMLAKIGIHKRLSSTVKQEFADLLKKYK